jgi:hypothetical protein
VRTSLRSRFRDAAGTAWFWKFPNAHVSRARAPVLLWSLVSSRTTCGGQAYRAVAPETLALTPALSQREREESGNAATDTARFQPSGPFATNDIPRE